MNNIIILIYTNLIIFFFQNCRFNCKIFLEARFYFALLSCTIKVAFIEPKLISSQNSTNQQVQFQIRSFSWSLFWFSSKIPRNSPIWRATRSRRPYQSSAFEGLDLTGATKIDIQFTVSRQNWRATRPTCPLPLLLGNGHSSRSPEKRVGVLPASLTLSCRLPPR